MTADTLCAKYVQVAVVVVGYWFVSIVTVFVNKTLFSSDKIDLDAPLFVTWYQCVTSTVICFTLKVLASSFPRNFSFPAGTPLDRTVFKKVFPLSVIFATMIVFNNLCLKYVDVAFYYIGRSLTTVFNVILSYMFLGQKTSLPAIGCCIVIISGFWLGVDQESLAGSLSVTGTMFGLLGSIALPLYSIHMKNVLPAVNQEIWLLSYYNNAYTSVLLIPLMVLNHEIPVILNYHGLFSLYFWVLMTIGGVCGFAIGFFTGLQIKVTSPLTHNISGTAKACFQTVIATEWYGEVKSALWWVSNLTVLGGSMCYTYVKQQEMKRDFVSLTPNKV
ncbi:GDP-fucose transporter 1 [Frankliniella fusca]|uniref:GDP-fucose transporter 1 n=1 Tax=Frankliniella fusca TaxID=407009 RepID=A0AAE1H2E9_9NEOP|nr:GDP-fucose transporter 1 [Frankliniella fusca]